MFIKLNGKYYYYLFFLFCYYISNKSISWYIESNVLFSRNKRCQVTAIIFDLSKDRLNTAIIHWNSNTTLRIRSSVRNFVSAIVKNQKSERVVQRW